MKPISCKPKVRKPRKITRGVSEWGKGANCCNGCKYNCRYCYAAKIAARFKRKARSEWHIMAVVEKQLQRTFRKGKQRFMFPTSHDIPPEEPFLSSAICFLRKMLEPGNLVLIVSKPSPVAIAAIIDQLGMFKDQIQFRFTITSVDDQMLAYWEPGAPRFVDRYEALKLAYNAGFETSISIEPCLDVDPVPLVNILMPWVNGTIWIGKMNYCGKHPFNSRETVSSWVEKLGSNPRVKFKDSVKNFLGGP